MSYVVAIPTYKRYNEVVSKTLKTLIEGKVSRSRIFLFVANKEEYQKYEEVVPKTWYNKMIIGKKGLANQRKFISKYFPEGQYIISIDDDIDDFQKLDKKGEKLVKVTNVHKLFVDAYKDLKKHNLFIWGVYPVQNPFFMYDTVTTDFKFIVGAFYGFINRRIPKLFPSDDNKEDYERTFLYYKKDKGVLRYNYITVKTKFLAAGGMGKDRIENYQKASERLLKKYPEFISKIFHRKNGLAELKLVRSPKI